METERVKPVPKPRKSIKRSATVNLRPDVTPTNFIRSLSTENLSNVQNLIEELPCTCPTNNDESMRMIEESKMEWPGVVINDESNERNDSLIGQTFPIDQQLPSTSTEMEYNDLSPNEPTLYDLITRSHPIWFLQQIKDRFSVCHLLRKTETGTFIVRSSSQPNSIALSVRMPPDWPVEVEHYLIEKFPNGGVKLEGSSNVFLTLPYLIQNYCLNGDEIKVQLKLPEAIQQIKSMDMLDKLSLLGQDFWSSTKMSRPPSVYSSHPTNDLLSLKMSQSMYGLASTAAQTDDCGNQTSPEFQTEPRRRSTMRLGTNSIANDYYSPPIYSADSWSQKKRPIQMGTSGLLKKSYSAYGIAAANDLDESFGGRSLKARSKRPANFLRNLFSSSTTTTNDQQTNKSQNKREHQHVRQPRTLTQCDDYFLPKTLSGLTDSSSFWSKPSVEHHQQASDCEWSADCKTCNPVTEHKHKRPVERLLSASSSVGRRLKAFTKQEKQQCTKDDMMFGASRNVDDHQILRRQNTDLCGSKLANYTPSSVRLKPNNMPEHRRFHTGPIVPPHAGRMSNNSMQSCIEELRLKRAANGSTSSKASSSRTDDSEDRPNVVLRVQEKPNQTFIGRDLNSRMSVPNLSASELSGSALDEDSRIPIVNLGRTGGGTGELKGLITPIVRRKKNYVNGNRLLRIPLPDNTKVDDPKHSRTSSEEQSTKKQLAESLAAELNNLASKNNKPFRQQDPDLKAKNLLRSQSVNQQTSPNASANKPEELPTFVHKIQPPSWTAVNRELKNRQLQIAKVKPQPIARSRQPATIGQKSNSDFNQLAKKAMEKTDSAKQNGEVETTSQLNGICEPITSLEDFKNEQDDDDDDIISTAGTVYNEPWSSNPLENLLDIAQFCDERPSKAKAKATYMESCTHETIAEEDDNYSYCGSVSTASISPYSQNSRNVPSPTHHSNSDVEVHEVSLSPEEKDDLVYGMNERPDSSDLTTNDILNLANNKTWYEVSKRVPSEASNTFDSRKDNRSRSMLNVADHANMTPVMERHQFRLRAQTPGNVFNNNFNDSVESFNTILPATSPYRLRTTNKNNDPGQKIQNYIEKLAMDSNNTLGASLQAYIECTIESENTDPRLVIKNARQFITGLKNFLTNGEAIQEIIEQESSKLATNEFLNIDAILETVLHKIVLITIKPHIYHLFCRESIKNGSFETLTANLSLVRTFPLEKLGFSSSIKSPDMKTIEQVRKHMRKMQNHYSPLKKFENLLNALTLLVKPSNSTLLRADSSKKLSCAELIRWIVYLLAKTSCVTCEIEAYYIFELLTPQLLTTGQVIYYLASMFTAIHILKNADSIERLRFISEGPNFTSPQASLQACINEAADGFFRCCVPNEHSGTIEFRLFPMIKELNVQRLSQIIANQLSISNHEEYGLFVLYDACETLLHGNECPLKVRLELNSTNKAHFFAYKRAEAKIAWPTSIVQMTSSASMAQPIQGTFGSAQSRYV